MLNRITLFASLLAILAVLAAWVFMAKDGCVSCEELWAVHDAIEINWNLDDVLLRIAMEKNMCRAIC